MRPNIRISHALNGRVKDFAAAEGINTDEAYRRIIERGLAELEGDGSEPASNEPDHETIEDALYSAYDGMDDIDARVGIGEMALNWLKCRDRPKKKGDFQSALYEEHHRDGEGEDTFYRKNVLPALKAARDAGWVEYRQGHHDWHWPDE